MLGEQFSRRSGIRLRRRLVADLPPLGSETEAVLYRVAQESLTNIVKHSEASHAELLLEPTDRGIRLEITDDGRGVNGRQAGAGIRGMRERALLVGGDLRIGRSRLGGVSVRLDVPWEDAQP